MFGFPTFKQTVQKYYDDSADQLSAKDKEILRLKAEIKRLEKEKENG